MKVIIVGGVAGGASAAARLRRLDENAQIIIYEKGGYVSYANCGLPYYIGNVIKERDRLFLNSPESFKDNFNIEVKIFHEVLSIESDSKNIKIKDLSTGGIFNDDFDKLILCPGSVPFKLPVEGTDADSVFTLWTVNDTDRIKDFIDSGIPKSAVIIGGGFIGLELAENLVNRNIEVSIVEVQNQVMASLDYEMAQTVHKEIASNGVKLYMGKGVCSIKKDKNNTVVTLSDGAEINADIVIMSAGVRPQTAFLEGSGIELNERGGIIVDRNMKTSREDIYAAGDAAVITDLNNGRKGMIPLAGPANKQGRTAADNICGISSVYEGTLGTSVAKVFDLTAASTGINEKRAVESGRKYGKDYDVIIVHPKSHAEYYPGASFLTIKLIFDPNDKKILGAQCTGYEGADKRIDVIASLIKMGGTVEDLAKSELAYAPPYSSAKDPVNIAGYTASNIIDGHVKMITWNRLNEIKDPLFLDVREISEFETGSIGNSLNIPLKELREKLSDLDKCRNTVIFCSVGLRGYYAYRILSANGFENIWNLNGGYNIYKNAFWAYNPSDFESTGIKIDRSSDMNSNQAREKYSGREIELDACGLSCPGPIQAVFNRMKDLGDGDVLTVAATDPGFKTDIASWCKRTGNTLIEIRTENKTVKAVIRKGLQDGEINVSSGKTSPNPSLNDKTIVVFSGDLDKAIASFIIANGAAAMGRKVTMFFTFWGLNVLRKSEKQNIRKDFISRMFAFMMPRGPKKLGLSRMNMAGAGPFMIKMLMKKHRVPLLEDQIHSAIKAGVNIIACRMSMDLMGISEAELVDGIDYAGVAAYLDAAEESDVNLFI